MTGPGTVRRFSCTQCGRCCDRAPEVELSEASALSDVFVFRLLFRLHWFPQQPRDARADGGLAGDTTAAFYEKKRLLAAFCARKQPIRLWRDGQRVHYMRYLSISALAVDLGSGACPALQDERCGIHQRRPQTCRSVPLHYSRGMASAVADFDAFVGTPGYRCDTSDEAGLILAGGEVVDLQIASARADALDLSRRDLAWREAISRQMSPGSRFASWLPTIDAVEENAARGALTTSMLVAWRIAVAQGFVGAEECRDLAERQLGAIGRSLADQEVAPEIRETLAGMKREYDEYLA